MKITQSYIRLEKLRFHAYHGVLPQERVVGNTYEVNLRLAIDMRAAITSDRLEDTLNYATLYEAIKQEMELPSNLLEHVAGRIVQRLLDEFSPLQSVELSLAKRNPPMGADIEAACVELHATRS